MWIKKENNVTQMCDVLFRDYLMVEFVRVEIYYLTTKLNSLEENQDFMQTYVLFTTFKREKGYSLYKCKLRINYIKCTII